MDYMNEGELILANTYDDIYFDLRRYLRHDDSSNFTKTFDYLLTLDPNVFQNYPIFTILLIHAIDYSDDIDMYYFINYLLDNGLNLNNTVSYSSLANINFPNITIFNKIIYNICYELNHMLDINISYDEYKEELERFIKILKIFFNHPPIFPNKGSPTLYEILDMFPDIKFAMIQILDDASFDVEKFKSDSRLAFAKSGLAPSIIDSILHHADIDTISHTGQNIHPNKYELKDKTFNRYDPLETFEEHLEKKGGKRSKKLSLKKKNKI